MQVYIVVYYCLGVGKTSLMQRYINDCFDPSYISTIGIDFKIKTLEKNGKSILLQIWDTAGQERFRSITTSYYRGTKGAIVVYDVTNRKSFLNCKMWIQSLRDGNDIFVSLCANKCDSPDRIITPEEGKQLANDHKIPYFEASAKFGNGVDVVFNNMCDTVLHDMQTNVIVNNNNNTTQSSNHKKTSLTSKLFKAVKSC